MPSPETDIRKEFILTSSANYFQEKAPDGLKSFYNDGPLNRFLDDPNCYTLSVRKKLSTVEFSHKVPEGDGNETVLVFFKIKPCVITGDNLYDNIFLSSMVDSPVLSLYYAIQKVFAPTLFKDQSKKHNIEPKLQSLVADLEAGLRSVAVKSKLVSENDPKKHSSLAKIMTVEDELEYWSGIEQSSRGKHEQEMAKYIVQALEPLTYQFKSIKATDLNIVEDFIDTAFNTLDDIWKMDDFNFPQSRMENLMNIIGNSVTSFIQQNLSNLDLWGESFLVLEDALRLAMSLCEKWIESCSKLSGLFWPNHSFHPWSGKPFTPTHLEGFNNRLKEILEIRTIHNQITRLLSSDEKIELSVDTYFSPFSGLNAFFYNAYTEPLWRSAVHQYEINTLPAEQKVGLKLKKQLSSVSCNVLQLFQEFKRYCDLLKRPGVQNMLIAERESLLSQLQQHICNIHPESGLNVSELMDLPPLVCNLYRVRQFEARVNDIEKIGQILLSSLNGYQDFENSLGQVRMELKDYHTQQLQLWTRETLEALSSNKLGLKTDEMVVHFEEGKLMRVNFSPRLVGLIKEVRHVSLMGYPVASEISEAAAIAKKFVTQAKALNQIASFHNSVGDKMISSQRAMMLNAARDLAKLVHSQHSVSWSDIDEVNVYIAKMQSQVERLARQNNELVHYHDKVMKKIEDLMGTELFKQEHMWKEGVRYIRDIVNQVEEKFSNGKSWRTHIDHQLYKALEYQYQLGLSGVNDFLPETRLDLVYRNNKVECFPTLKSARKICFKKLKKLLLIPLYIQPIGDVQIFREIVYRNASRFGRTFLRIEKALADVEELAKSWQEWVVLTNRNTEKLAESNLKTSEDWTENFKSSKLLAQQIAKLPSVDYRINFFVVGVTGVRSEVELQNRLFWDNLANWLRSSIIRNIAAVRSFLEKATITLQSPPKLIEDIGEANKVHQELLKEGQEVLAVLEELDRKNVVLRAWTKDNLEEVNQVKTEWANFQVSITDYHLIIGKQVEMMKTNIVSEADILKSDVERFSLRWAEMKPKEEMLGEGGTHEENLRIIREKQSQWNELVAKISKLRDQFIKFNMEPPNFDECEEIDCELKQYEENWSLFELFNSGLQELKKEEWIVIRNKAYQLLDSFLQHWNEKLKSIPASSIVVKLMHEVESYKGLLPVLKFVGGEMFTEKHWLEVFTVLKTSFKQVQSITFGDFLDARDVVKDASSALQEINARAAGEIVIRQSLSELDIWEVEAKFNTVKHTDSKGTTMFIIKDFKSIMNKVGDNQCLLQSIKGSPNYEFFEDRTKLWESRLADLDNSLRNLSQIQRKWLYLEPILTNGTLERPRFERIDKELKHLLRELANAEFRVIALTRIQNVSHTLQQLLQNLNQCQRSLMDFLEEKRLRFPRFYFLSDEDLLEILGQSEKQSVIQSHLKKVFSGIHSVEFSGNTIISMVSAQGESVPLINPITVTQNVEDWLGKLAVGMKSTLKQLVKECLDNPDPMKYPSQIICLTEKILFTQRVEQAIRQERLLELKSEIKEQLHEYTRQQLEWTGKYSGPKSVVLELKLKALLLDTIYHMSVVEGLIENGTKSIDNWHWQKRIRFYYEKDGLVVLRMVDAEFVYSYEYQGNAPKLVHTPLTDKCFLTLTQAMNLGLGGNLYGPAGTGKTESVKALGSLLGRQVLVFNCDEGIDVQSLTRILVGLVKCGAWGCFDEFNRLEEVTLSAISQQIHSIQQALRVGADLVTLLGKDIDLDNNTGIFVTLNPVGKGYGGRQKLPENLKQLFRPVIMSKPDDTLIAEVILHCEGFKLAKIIGHKLVTLFDLCKKLLSPQQHYDWGLRALKTVVGGCGSALRQFLSTNKSADPAKELELIVQAVRLNTLCKLTFADCRQFEDLINDLFPGVNLVHTGHEKLQDSIRDCYSELGLVFTERQCHKCLEVFEQLQQRMGVVIVGPPGTGKSTIISLLKHALIKQGMKVRHNIINPKAMPKNQLLGQIDIDTRQWTYGVLTLTAQEVYNEPQDVECWIQCDGDVDPEWIESLNSVLDDNRLLTLPSGWRIQFGPNVHFLFETDDLRHASPATISRMGIIHLSNEDIDLAGYIEAWLFSHSSSISHILPQLISEHLLKGVVWVLNKGHLSLQTSEISLVKNGLSLMEGVQTKAGFIVAMINGLGANLLPESKEEFAKVVFEWLEEYPLPSSMLTYCYYDEEMDKVEGHQTTSSDFTEGSTLVRTPLVNVTIDVLLFWLKSNQPFIVIGPPGCGKSMLLEYCFQQIRGVQVVTIHCSAHITPQLVLQKLSQVCMVVSNSTGRVFCPKIAERIVLHFSDINLVHHDKWGTSMLISFLQQVMTYNGFFDSNLEWVGLDNVQIICSLSSADNLSKRFVSINRIIYIRTPNKFELHSIYSIYVKSLFGQLNSEVVSSMVNVYENVVQAFSPLQQPHYIFTPRDLTMWCTNLLRYNTKSVSEFYQAFGNEAVHLFEDKLVTDEERARFVDILSENIPQINIKDLYKNDVYYIGDNTAKVSVYGLPLTKISYDDFDSLTRRNILQFGEELTLEKTVIVPEFLQMIATTDRALTRSKGGLLLAGKTGIGRKMAVRIVAARHNAIVHSPKLVENYSVFNFKNDLKAALQLAGMEDQMVFFLLEDFQLVHSDFLEMVNSLISSGEVPGLYHAEELENLTLPFKDVITQNNFDGSTTKFFYSRVEANLRVIFIFDYDHPQFRSNLQANPAILKYCHVRWCLTWTQNTMKFIAENLLLRSNETLDVRGKKLDIPQNIIEAFPEIHERAADFTVVTPRRFLAFIETFIHLQITKRYEIEERSSRLEAGVHKLTEARDLVHQLKVGAKEQEILLAEKQTKSKKVLDKISDTMANANLHRNEMQNLREITEKENAALQARKREIDEELSEIEPLIQEARAAVGNIKTEALSEIRSLRAPPKIIRDILEGVIRLMGIEDTSWNSMKTFLAKRGVKEDIRCFDASQIREESREAVEALLQAQRDSFEPRNAKRASVAAAPLAAWVKANVKYSHVLEKIRPLEQEQAKLQRNLEVAAEQIGELGSGLDNVDATVAKLKEQLNTSTREAAEIEIHLSTAQETLTAAEGLVSRLDDEYSIWKLQLSELTSSVDTLEINCFLSAAFITYLADCTEDVRIKMINSWKKVLKFEGDFSLVSFLCSESELLKWSAEGLPPDQMSHQNAVIILHTTLCPLLVDPTHLASNWLAAHFPDHQVDLISQQNSKFYTKLELAIRFGRVLIILDVNDVDPMLMPILRGEFIYQGPRKMVLVGDKLIDYNNQFKLFLVSRNLSSEIWPDARAVITLVSFKTTREGLTQQLLEIALKEEKPLMEKRRVELLKEEETLKSKLYVLQENVLKELANAQGNILQNNELLESLQKSKQSSLAIQKSLGESKVLQEELTKECEIYRPLAQFGAKLYFACSTLNNMNNMYYISIGAFLKLFQRSLGGHEIIDDMQSKCKTLSHLLFNYVSRSLFKADRLGFALHLVHEIHSELFQPNEWEVFIGKSVGDAKADLTRIGSEIPGWVDNNRVYDVYTLKCVLPETYDKLNLENESLWSEFMNSSSPKCPKHCQLSEFQIVLIVHALRPDRLHAALVNFASHALGLKSLSPAPLQLNSLINESGPSEPILLITSPGADPSEELSGLAQILMQNKYKEVALSQGQVTEIPQLLAAASENGQWLLLKNLHLLTSWLPTLEKELQLMSSRHENFRLWLTTEPHTNFSTGLLSTCLKVTYEAPEGVKHNLERTYSAWDVNNELVPNLDGAKAMFTLAWFHAVVQERRTYIPQGWSHFYEFNDSDLSAACCTIKKKIEGNRDIDHVSKWEHIHGLLENAIYGGRVENPYDLQVLSTYLTSFFNSEVLTQYGKALVPGIYVPQTSSIKDHFEVIKQLPETDLPAFFGLPANVDRSWQRVTSSKTVNQIKVLDQSVQKGEALNIKELHGHISPILRLWKKLNQGVGIVHAVVPPTIISPSSSPLKSFFNSELLFSIKLVNHIHENLASITRVVKGVDPITEPIIQLSTSVMQQKTPESWQNIWDGPCNPNRYIQSVMARATSVQNLQANWKKLCQKPLDLSDMFHVDTFLSSLRLQIARSKQSSVEELILTVQWGHNDEGIGKEAILVDGLQLEGALFINNILTECSPESPSVITVPTAFLSWVVKEQHLLQTTLTVPLYSSQSRQKLISELEIPCDEKDKSKWIQSGTAFYLRS